MTLEYRPLTQEEMPGFERVMGLAFGEVAPPNHVSTWTPLLQPDRTFAGFDGKDMVGGATVAALGITVPGANVPAAALLGAAVLPTHRRRGVLRTLLKKHFEDMRERGETVTTLWASESIIYGRFGYAVGALSVRYDIDRIHAGFTPDQGGARSAKMRFLDGEDAFDHLAPVYEKVRPVQVGTPQRSPGWWRHIHSDAEHRRGGASPLFIVGHESDGELDGYAIYRLKEEQPEDGLWAFRLLLKELIASTNEAYAAVWRFCLNVDMVDRIVAENRPIDDPIVHMLADSRRLRRRVSDGMWIRLLDVPAALAQRSYRTAGSVVFGVHDALCDWNDGNIRLEAGPDGTEVRAAGDPPDLECEQVDLAAAYLGTCSFTSLARAGRVVERVPGALVRADAMFAWDPAPWCANVF